MTRGATGLHAWLLQRISAVYLALFLFFLSGHFLFHGPASYDQWQAWVHQSWVGLAMALFFLALLVHAWVGTRDVLMDYVQPPFVRLLLLTLTAVGLIGCGIWALQVVLLSHAIE